MNDMDVVEVHKQLEQERKAREESDRRIEEERKGREEFDRRVEEERKVREEAARRVEEERKVRKQRLIGARGAYPSTTTRKALGVTSLTLLKNYKVIGNTDKCHTRKLIVDGQEIVAKLVDFLGVPKHSDFSDRDLYDLEWNEVRIYHHLREVQGILIPRFLYHGMDFNSVWATAVTTYEGEPLSKLELTPEIQAAALTSLRELHALDVLHGDVALRNAVWNGQKVKWVDFELSSIREEVRDFDKEAQTEIQDLLHLLDDSQKRFLQSNGQPNLPPSASVPIDQPHPADPASIPFPADCQTTPPSANLPRSPSSDDRSTKEATET